MDFTTSTQMQSWELSKKIGFFEILLIGSYSSNWQNTLIGCIWMQVGISNEWIGSDSVITNLSVYIDG